MSRLVVWLHGFMKHVEREGECWIWTGSMNREYGKYNGGIAHREAYKRLVGPIPDGLTLDHLCRRPACVNPLHMEPVSRAENQRRANEARTHCKKGHEFTAENTYLWRGVRRCRICAKAYDAEYRRRRQAEGAPS